MARRQQQGPGVGDIPRREPLGRLQLAIEFELGEPGNAGAEDDAPTSEEDVLELMKSTFDARELDE